jgi:L-asparaginase II
VIRLVSGVPLVDVQRSGVVESGHTGSVVLINADGTHQSLGCTDQVVFPRSANKPLQAVGMLRAGLDVPPPWLALATASHSGEPIHVERVTEMLGSVGLDESALQCPPDWPVGEQARLVATQPRRITMNCSGKHAAMLLTCRVNDWPITTYLEPEHPLQQAMRDAVGDESGEPVAATGVDGCGAPLFAISLLGLGRAFARIATAEDGPERAVADAMRAHPELVAGRGRTATLLMRSASRIIAKDGAEGVYAAALPDGRAVALKIDDGAQRAIEPVMVAALQALGVHIALPEQPVLGGGRPVGAVRVRAGVFG